jgi:hypothetical protein
MKKGQVSTVSPSLSNRLPFKHCVDPAIRLNCQHTPHMTLPFLHFNAAMLAAELRDPGYVQVSYRRNRSELRNLYCPSLRLRQRNW